jgi:hypothetical protein
VRYTALCVQWPINPRGDVASASWNRWSERCGGLLNEPSLAAKYMRGGQSPVSHQIAQIFVQPSSKICRTPPWRATFVVNSEPYTGARHLVRLCVGLTGPEDWFELVERSALRILVRTPQAPSRRWSVTFHLPHGHGRMWPVTLIISLINDHPHVPGHDEVSCEGLWVHIRRLGVCISILKALFAIIKTTQKCFILKLWIVAVYSIQKNSALLLSAHKGLLSMLA